MLRSSLLRRNMPPLSVSSKFLLPALAAAVLLAACGDKNGGQHGMPPAPVSAMTVAATDIPVDYEYVAQTAGSREVEIRARVTGILMKRNYTEGAMVKAGQSLFTLDLAPYELAAARADADLATAEANLAQAQRQAARLKPLIEANAVSQKDYDDATSAVQVATASVKSARANLNTARLNLQYARVDSPITGLASRALKSEGALVSGPDVLLTTVSQVDPIYINFGVPDSDQLKLRNDIASGVVKLPPDGKLDVQVKYPDGTPYPKTGKMDFSDVRINPSTGMSDSRAELPNPNLALRPGMFVRVHLSGAVRVNAIKVPQRAVLEAPGGGKMVYLVGSDGKGGNIAQPRPVEVGDWVGDAWVVRSGLKPGDQVITEGMAKIFFPGAPIMIGPPPGAAGAPGAGGPGGAGKGAPPDAAKGGEAKGESKDAPAPQKQ